MAGRAVGGNNPLSTVPPVHFGHVNDPSGAFFKRLPQLWQFFFTRNGLVHSGPVRSGTRFRVQPVPTDPTCLESSLAEETGQAAEVRPRIPETEEKATCIGDPAPAHTGIFVTTLPTGQHPQATRNRGMISASLPSGSLYLLSGRPVQNGEHNAQHRRLVPDDHPLSFFSSEAHRCPILQRNSCGQFRSSAR